MGKYMKTLSSLSVLVSGLILFYLLVIFVGGVVQIAEAADRLYLGLGQPIFISLLLLLLGLIATPLYIYLRFPAALVPPNVDSGPEHDRYMLKFRQMLASNPKLVGTTLASDGDIKIALEILAMESDKVIRNKSGAVFLGTALCQNGKLDGLITLTTQVKLVWEIACVYNQRPSPKQMLHLYSQVALCALFAESIDDYDFSEILSPILSAALAGGAPSVSGSLLVSAAGAAEMAKTGGTTITTAFSDAFDAGTKGAVRLITNSVVDGTANAFLTLRIGCIAKQYCEALATPDKSLVRRYAAYAAASMVGDIVKDNSVRIFSTTIKKTSDRARGAVKKMAGTFSQGTQSVFSGVDSAIVSTKQFAKKITTRKE